MAKEFFFKMSLEDGLATMTLGREPTNSLTPDFMEAICMALEETKGFPPEKMPRALLIKSSIEGQFCHGMDAHYFVAADADERKRMFLLLAEMLEAFYKFGIPVITDIAGPAMAGGAVLALLGDVVIMDAAKGNIAFTEVKVGLPVPNIIQDLIVFKAGTKSLVDMALFGKNINAAKAQSMGMANAVYHNEEERAQLIDDYLGRIKRLSSDVVAATLWQIKEPLIANKIDYIHSFEDAFAPYLTDEYLGKGLLAVTKGEKPIW